MRFLGVEFSPLAPRATQPSLFPNPEAERAGRLISCKDAIRQRFGFMSVLSGTSLAVAGQVEQDRERVRLRMPCLTR